MKAANQISDALLTCKVWRQKLIESPWARKLAESERKATETVDAFFSAVKMLIQLAFTICLWIVIAGVVLLVGAAVVHWAIRELGL